MRRIVDRHPAFQILIVGLLFIGQPESSAAPIVELVANGTSFQGSPLAHNESLCWLISPDGRLHRVDLAQVTGHRLLTREFRRLSAVEVGNELRSTLNRQQELEVRGDFVVIAPRGRASIYGSLLDTTSRSFHSYFSRRGILLPSSTFAMVVEVLDSRSEFDEICQADGMPTNPLLRGYYSPESNRVVIHDPQETVSASTTSGGRRAATETLDPTVRDTIVHEAVHQLAFNADLHSRIGRNPRWVVEGLATVLEAEGFLIPRTRGTGSPVNQDRLERFRDMVKQRRQASVGDFVAADDSLFMSDPLDAYAQAWALSYYLMETRPSDYRSYLQKIAARDPLSPAYSPNERLADFQSAFGNDVRLLESRLLRFIDGLP